MNHSERSIIDTGQNLTCSSWNVDHSILVIMNKEMKVMIFILVTHVIMNKRIKWMMFHWFVRLSAFLNPTTNAKLQYRRSLLAVTSGEGPMVLEWSARGWKEFGNVITENNCIPTPVFSYVDAINEASYMQVISLQFVPRSSGWWLLKQSFGRGGVKLIGLSWEEVRSHSEWIKDIKAYNVSFSIHRDSFGIWIVRRKKARFGELCSTKAFLHHH